MKRKRSIVFDLILFNVGQYAQSLDQSPPLRTYIRVLANPLLSGNRSNTKMNFSTFSSGMVRLAIPGRIRKVQGNATMENAS